jgi:hypothetical protein
MKIVRTRLGPVGVTGTKAGSMTLGLALVLIHLLQLELTGFCEEVLVDRLRYLNRLLELAYVMTAEF